MVVVNNLEEIERFLELFSGEIQAAIREHPIPELIEVVMDLGRPPEIRFKGKPPLVLEDLLVLPEDLQQITDRVSDFSSENRAGIERTLHRISAIRNRQGKIIGLTCRVGRTITGTIDLLEDLFPEEKSLLILGPPGSGKTSKLREIAYLYSVKAQKRVIVVDTSLELGGDGDLPHPSLGRARRMPVHTPEEQHKVMIEAVENHTPEVIIIDEISTLEESIAAQTIAERGVMLIATAHGRDLENLVKNPALSILVGAPQTVTLSDEEAKKRRTQKNVQERSCPATFQIVVEILSFSSVIVHRDVNASVDQILRGEPCLLAETRHSRRETSAQSYLERLPLKVYPYAISQSQIKSVAKSLGIELTLVDVVDKADVIVSLEGYANEGAKIHRLAKLVNIPIKTISDNSFEELRRVLNEILQERQHSSEQDLELSIGLEEASQAIEEIRQMQNVNGVIELTPRKEAVRRAQQRLIQQNDLSCFVLGEGANKRLVIETEQ